jgi:AbiV family abortive infection protein
MTRAFPGRRDLAGLAQASLLTARDILDDARLLLDAGKTPRAHSLAVLALEEIGKAHLCMIPICMPTLVAAGEFWTAFYSHQEKLRWARAMLGFMIREPDGPLIDLLGRTTRACHSDHVRKLRGFYVDYIGTRIVTPADVSPAEAQELIADVQALLDFQMPAWGDADAPDRLLRRLDEIGGDFTATYAELEPAIMADPDEAVAQVRRVIHAHMRGELEQ